MGPHEPGGEPRPRLLKLEAGEQNEPVRTWWLSFVDEGEFLGVAIVRARGIGDAIRVCGDPRLWDGRAGRSTRTREGGGQGRREMVRPLFDRARGKRTQRGASRHGLTSARRKPSGVI